jgi:diacylglycerol O-acyltransferase
VSARRLSALDASFLAVESPTAPMHVGWVSSFDPPEDGPRPGFAELFDHIAGRLEIAPRYRQKLASVPLGVHGPLWVDDPDFDPAAHLLHAEGDDLDEIADAIFSTPLPRDRPLWQMWIADGLPDGRLAMIGKMHHCMVDGIAVVELGEMMFDAAPDAGRRSGGPAATPPEPADRGGGDAWTPAPVPSASTRFARAVADRAADGAALAFAPVRLAGSPGRLRGLPGLASRGARTLSQTLLPPAPGSSFNRPGSPRRHHVRVTRSLDDVRMLRRRFGVTPNDVVLATCAGALRRFAWRRGEAPQGLKVMVPADVRGADDAEGGNRISFVFIDLPCDEPDPVARLQAVHRATSQRGRDGAAEDLDAAFRALSLAPGPVQRTLAHAFAHPRMSNLTISSVPGPAVPRYLYGCRLREVHSAVPLSERHALSIGVVIVAGRVCFGIYADAETLPDADALGEDLDAAFEELLATEA